MPDEIITKAELARRIGVDRSRATAWEDLGMPTLPDGRVEAGAAEAWVRRHVDATNRNRRHSRLEVHAQADREREARIEAIDTLARLGVWFMAQNVPEMVARTAIEVGMPLEKAQALHDTLLTRASEMANDVREKWMGLPPGETGPFKRMDHLPAVDWAALQLNATAVPDRVSSPRRRKVPGREAGP